MTASPSPLPVTRALISVSDKTGIVDLATYLQTNHIEILSTGGTAQLLMDKGISVIEVSDYTGFPEMMDGRVKTLHPKIHGGILGRRGIDDAVMEQHNIPSIDIIIVNLYPFESTIAKAGCTLEEAIENIDIGGPTMVRASAKNHANVGIVVDPGDYSALQRELAQNAGTLSHAFRFDMAVKAFEHTARYDGMIANYLGARTELHDNIDPNDIDLNDIDPNNEAKAASVFPRTFNMQFIKTPIQMRYGENPHQSAAFYVEHNLTEASVATAKQIQGKDLSYNNISDTDAALECVKQFSDKPACVIVKHANPCGVAYGSSLADAYQRAFETDPESAFGGIIAFNQELDGDTAQLIVDKQFVEVIIAPSVSAAAIEVVRPKKNIRLLECGIFIEQQARFDYKRVNAGLLVQDADLQLYENLTIVSERQPSEHEMRDLLFGWKVAKFVKSNAIIYTSNEMTMGIGAGQMSRINSARIASIKARHAGLEVKGSMMASDAFFPFRDGIDQAAEDGIAAVIQPGGSMRDEEVIQAANEHGMAMVFTGMRHFRH